MVKYGIPRSPQDNATWRARGGWENERARARDVILRSQFVIRVERGNKAEGEDDRGYIGWAVTMMELAP